MKNVVYFKASLDRQEVKEQRQAVVEFAERENIAISRFIEMPSSATGRKRIDQLFRQLEPGDTLIVSELSRIGRSVGQIVRTVDALIKGNIRFIAVKEGIWLDEERNSQTQAMVRMFGLLAETDRELVSIHTREGLAAARNKGKKLGRPKGSLGRSKLDGRTEEIRRLLALGVSKASIARIMGVERTTVVHFVKSRGLVQDS
jgi:DNA invertase Pin-like site-specific DNA recombinase